MSLGGALDAALSGLRATSANLELVSHNISNANTPGYTRKIIGQVEQAPGGNVAGVRLGDTTRVLDELVNRQLQLETSGLGYAETLSNYYTQLDAAFGQPGGATSLDTLMNNFHAAMEELATSPESDVAREGTLYSAQVLATTLNGLTADIQTMRTQTEQALNNAVERVNEILQDLSDLNSEITTTTQAGRAPASLLDRRDSLISELSHYVDVRVQERERGEVGIYTSSGTLLLDGSASTLSFDSRGTMNAASTYSTDPADRTVGTIKLDAGSNYSIDLIADSAFRSGEIKALIDLRDNILPQAQAQLDAVADVMARSLSSKQVDSTAATSGAQTGLSIDLAGLQDGDSLSLTYTDGSGEHTVTIVRVDEAGAPAIGNDDTAKANDTVIAISFAGGFAAAAADIDAALGGSLTASASGSTLTILDDGATNTTDVTGLTATVTETSLSGGTSALPFFVDGGEPPAGYTARHGTVSQITGFAGRIQVNQALFADPSKLVEYTSGIPSGDNTRPQAILDRLVLNDQDFSGASGVVGEIGFSGTLPDFINRIISFQGREAESAQRAYNSQEVAYQQLSERQASISGVDLDQEMAFLISLQTAYQANARVISTFREMTDLLLRI
ncbi:flagellar hook-associated protein FlgK [Tepidamorphus sp. 3E244]|uniref:flagellar hook-associated protein FlgK n=1 Tax=Tepidamorphus sp. 3E244 TaxID=3385498 RepID=UPI0038FD0FEF